MTKDSKTESISVILPCVGRDTRLNLPYPKELIRISEKMSVIDCSFQHVLASRVKPRVVAVIGPHELDIARYLYEKYNDKVDLVVIFQKASHKDFIGVVRSAGHLLSDKNILLMPTSIIERSAKEAPLLDAMLDILDRQPFVFAYKAETSVTRLKLSGALQVEDQKVIGYEDKPLKHTKKYNAFWTSFGFKKEVFNEVISVIEQGMLKKTSLKKVFRKSVMYKSLSIMVDDYVDISTWTNLNAYLMKQYLIKSGIDSHLFKIDPR